MDIRLYRFNKKENSTKRPIALTPYYVVEGCTINNSASTVCHIALTLPSKPVIDSQNVNTTYQNFNYVFIPVFNRFYWIRDWRYNGNGTFTAYCEVDPLASWAGYILNGSGYISRTGNEALATDNIPDDFYNAIPQYTTVSEPYTLGHYTADPKGGTFVIGTVVTTAPEYGAVNYYMVPVSEMSILVSNMVATKSGTQPPTADEWKNTSLTGDILKSLVSPMQYLVSCKWFPFHTNYMETQMVDVWLGQWPSGARGIKLVGDDATSLNPFSGNNNDVYTYHALTIPKVYPTTEGYGRIAEYPPYTKYTFISPTFGTLALDPIVCCSRDELIIDIVTNLITGDARTTLSYFGNPSDTAQSENLQVLAQTIKPLAIDINLTQVAVDYLNMTKSALDAGGSAVNAFLQPWNAGTNVVNAVKSGLDAVAYSFSPNVSGNGSAGGTFWYDIDNVIIQAQFQHTTPRYPAEFGKPYNRFESLAGHNGYFVQCTDYHPSPLNDFNPAILKEEYELIIDYLKNGVFLE